MKRLLGLGAIIAICMALGMSLTSGFLDVGSLIIR